MADAASCLYAHTAGRKKKTGTDVHRRLPFFRAAASPSRADDSFVLPLGRRIGLKVLDHPTHQSIKIRLIG